MEGTIVLRQYLYIIRKWLWLIILVTLSAAGVARAVSINTPSTYRASATLLINEADSPTSATYQDILSSERVARTYAELLRKRPIFEGTAARLGLRDVDVRELPFSVDVKPIRDTQLIDLGVESTHPGLAAQAADTIPQVFIEQHEGIQSRRFASPKENLSHQMARLEEDIKGTEEAIARLKESSGPSDRAERARLDSLLAQRGQLGGGHSPGRPEGDPARF